MPEKIETVVYRLDELEESARETARDWFRSGAFDHDWYEFVYDDFETICGILGVRLATRPVKLYCGGTRNTPRIYFSGFASQGDGACFEGSYAYVKAAPAAMRAHAPQDAELSRIAQQLQSLQRRNFYQLTVIISHRGRYYHEYSMEIAAERDNTAGQSMSPEAEQMLAELLRDLARWLYRQLESEHDHLISAEVVDEAIRANDFTFTECGERFGRIHVK
jgi:hypothetical protein